jgi:DNA repair exonuclease SbcCD ATPase subunit
MKVSAITMLIWFAITAIAGAQGGGAPSKASLSEVRALVHELQGHTDKLRELMSEYRSLVERRPQPEGGSPEAKKAHEQQLEKWTAALERLMRRVDVARTAVVETVQRLDRAAAGQQLPTALAKDLANARNDAEAQRATAEQALAQNKPAPARPSKHAKQTEREKEPPPLPDDLDL